jgi:hypothetical protein
MANMSYRLLKEKIAEKRGGIDKVAAVLTEALDADGDGWVNSAEFLKHFCSVLGEQGLAGGASSGESKQ